jgi:hypothetical protein
MKGLSGLTEGPLSDAGATAHWVHSAAPIPLLHSGIIGMTFAIGLWLLGVPFFYVLALIEGVGEMIPVVGPILRRFPRSRSTPRCRSTRRSADRGMIMEIPGTE